MKIPLRKALWLAVGPANVDAAGHAVADWFDGIDRNATANRVREALRDQPGQPAPDAVPHNRPDTSLRSELLQKLATHREVLLNLCNRVDRLEMRADGLTPIERVERRWAKKSTGGDKLDRLIAQDKEADGPAVPEDREPAAARQPTDAELLELSQFHCISYTLSDGTVVSPFEEGTDMRSEVLSFARAVLARWGHQSAPPAEGEVGEEDEDALCLLNLRRRVEALEQRAAAPDPAANRPIDDPLEPFTLEELDGLAEWLAAREYCGAASALRIEARRAREGQ